MRQPAAALVLVAIAACIVVPISWRVAAKAGYNPRFALLMMFSPVNIVLAMIFAVREWPIERELRLERQRRPE